MAEGSAGFAQTVWASAIVTGLQRHGIQDLVISPGSRSTPLLIAAAQRPDIIRLWPLIDERVAAFFALGAARELGRPMAMLCTSGSAGAHYHPALVEAKEAGIPLCAITADRPPELLGCAAPQTTDQRAYFAAHVRSSVSLGPAREEQLPRMCEKLDRCLSALKAPFPGPVHLNLHFEKPLQPLPGSDTSSGAREVEQWASTAAPRPAAALADPAAIERSAQRLTNASRPLIVIGPGSAAQRRVRNAVAGLAGRFPVLAETSSDVRFVRGVLPALDLVAKTTLPKLDAPDLIVELGRPPTSTWYARFLSTHRDIARVVLSATEAADPQRNAADVVRGDIERSITRLEELTRKCAASAWYRSVAESAASVQSSIHQTIADEKHESSEHSALQRVFDSLAHGTLVVIGNSLPIRTADEICLGTGTELDIASQRGASGIDGLIAGAAGAASVANRDVCLVIGDVSFAHDASGLAALRHAAGTVVIVIINNQGGRIFDGLPVADDPACRNHMDRLFTMKTDVSARDLASAYGVHYALIDNPGIVGQAVADGFASRQHTVIEVPVPPTSAQTTRRAIEDCVRGGAQ